MKEISQITGKKSSEVDVAVLLIFFTRTEQTVRTFEQIRKARPSRLYLYQDGPRQGRTDDVENIAKCRKAVEDMIDWDCDIHKFYQENNFGCDPSEYISQKWMFSNEEKGIVIEDDDVMSVSFFRFCKELLDRYENDTRINMICGMNHLGIYEDCPYDYFFTRTGTIWGWASWRRVIDQWDRDYSAMGDDYTMRLLKDNSNSGKEFKSYIARCRAHLESGREHYESISSWCCKLNGRYNIIPKYNMTCNIGIANESTHSVSDISKLPRAVRKMMYMDTHEVSFPIKHPIAIVEDKLYSRKYYQVLYGSKLTRFLQLRRLETLLYRILPFLGT